MDGRPSIKKVDRGPVNPSKRKNPRLVNRSVKKINGKFKLTSVIKKPIPPHNPSLIKGEFYKKQGFRDCYHRLREKNKPKGKMVNMNGAFREDKNKINSKNVRRILSISFLVIIILVGASIKFIACDGKKVFKGKEYFKYLGISKEMACENMLYGTYGLVEIENIALGTFSYDGEQYYRFQATNGTPAYDSEITDYQGELVIVAEGTKPRVEVYKRLYRKNDSTTVSIYYYKLYVPESKIKRL